MTITRLAALVGTILLGLSGASYSGSFPEVGPLEWPMYGHNPHRTFNHPTESKISPATVGSLVLKWVHTFGDAQSTTATPSVAWIDRDGDGVEETKGVFIGHWGGQFFALDAANGTVIWDFRIKDRSSPDFGPFVTQAAVVRLSGETRKRLYVGGAHILYCLDAATGQFLWRFDTVDGTTSATNGADPLSHALTARQLESSPVVYTASDGVTRVYFGMDVNEGLADNGAFYALDAFSGTLSAPLAAANGPGDASGAGGAPSWKFEPSFDPKDASVDRRRNSCGNIWSSAAVDENLDTVYFALSNCDVEETLVPFDEHLVSLDAATGSLRWAWGPRRFDHADLAFGATPIVLTLTDRDLWPDLQTWKNVPRDVVGNLPRIPQLPGGKFDKVVTRNMVILSGKDGFHYGLDRATGGPPFWQIKVSQGGSNGGIIGSATAMTYADAAGETKTRVFSGSAIGGVSGPFPGVFQIWDPIGLGPLEVMRTEPNTSVFAAMPAFRAVDAFTGRLAWEAAESNLTFGPTTSANGVVFQQDVTGMLRAYDAETGAVLWRHETGPGSASGAAISDGEIFIGSGIFDVPFIVNAVYAFCLAGGPGCEPAVQ